MTGKHNEQLVQRDHICNASLNIETTPSCDLNFSEACERQLETGRCRAPALADAHIRLELSELISMPLRSDTKLTTEGHTEQRLVMT